MSQGIKIKKNEKPQAPTVSQSIPTDFYRNYVPPPTPKLKPMNPLEIILDDNVELPPPSFSDNWNIKISHSLTNKYAMSMPTTNLMGGGLSSNKEFSLSPFNNNDDNDSNDNNKIDPKSNENKFAKKVISGSFTCFQLMTQIPSKDINSILDEDTNISLTDSTFANNENDDDNDNDNDNDNDSDNDNNDDYNERKENKNTNGNNKDTILSKNDINTSKNQQKQNNNDDDDDEMPFDME